MGFFQYGVSILGFKIYIKGIVQGVGFRPYIFRISEIFGVIGSIQNLGNLGVLLIGRFKPDVLKSNDSEHTLLLEFIEAIKSQKPDIAFIESIDYSMIENSEISYDSLEILPSINNSELAGGMVLPADVGICDNCLKDFWDVSNPRYYKYPFIACAECGPRYSTVYDLPYDRVRTTMDIFPLCGSKDRLDPLDRLDRLDRLNLLNKNTCMYEYLDPKNRRFHAQTFSCSKCGPHYLESVSEAADLLKKGKIVSVKGIGGTHLVCSALDASAIELLRSRKKKRNYKPFAIMYPSIQRLVESNQFILSEIEINILKSFRRPIVLLVKSDRYSLPEKIAPGLPNVGVMLPYAGIHHLLFSEVDDIPLVYTSGNPSNMPMAIENDEIKNTLSGLADSFLLHNRDIYQRVDDSVMRVILNKPTFIRRSRGYAPEYISLPFETESLIIACGAEENSTGALLANSRIFPTQHIGTITTQETLEFLESSLHHLMQLLGVSTQKITAVTRDLHPGFLSNTLAEEFHKKYNCAVYKIQHHHAHHAALMIDSKCAYNEKICSISVDGVGYGSDGSIWGGEILVGGFDSVERKGGLLPIPMIGGDRSALYPSRMLACFLLANYPKIDAINLIEKHRLHETMEFKEKELKYIIDQFNDLGSVIGQHRLCSSAGRFLDAVSSLLDVCHYRSYRGEPAMKLEGTAQGGISIPDFNIESYIEGCIIRTDKILRDLVLNHENSYNRRDIAYSVLYQLGRGFMLIGLQLCEQLGIEKIGCTGGVTLNEIFMQGAHDAFEEHKNKNMKFLQHEFVAPGDAGISVGQIGVAAALIKSKKPLLS